MELSTYVIEVVRGTTLFREIAILDSDREPIDVSLATKSVQVGDGLSEVDFTVNQGTASHLIELRSVGAQTAAWPLGSFPLRIWLDWGVSADVEDEVIFSATLVSRSEL